MDPLRGKVIALEGIDGVGKSTAAAALAELLRARGLEVVAHDFPVYDEPAFGPLIGAFLRGELRIDGDRAPQVTAALFAGNRAATAAGLRAERDAGRTLLCDRYHLSNAAYQGAKVPPEEQDALIDWVLAVELDVMGALKPDVSLWLDVPPQLRPQADRSQRAYLEGKEDVHERDADLQRRVHAVYARLAARGDVVAVSGAPDGVLLAPDDIAQRLLAAADQAAGGRTAGAP